MTAAEWKPDNQRRSRPSKHFLLRGLPFAGEVVMDFHYEFVQHINFDQFDGYLEIDAFFINFDRNFMINQ